MQGAATCVGVLLVEDEKDLREVMTMALEIEGFEVKTAANGREALELLRQKPEPCLILLDLMMPVMSGWDFLAERRSSEALRSIPVVIVSAFAPSPPPDTDAVIPKPIKFDKLIDLVQRYCIKPA